MIVRIVQMTFREDCIKQFSDFFEARKHIIRGFDGCMHLQLWQDSKQPNIFFTYSHWETEAHLDHYRFSDFFKDTWGKTKAMFKDKPQAWSVIIKSTG
jgi:heme-degrading monooxygenase HmoA